MLGPLATYAEPHCYDLCEVHARRLVAPRGWDVVRQQTDPADTGPTSDDLEALANAVREAARPANRPEPAQPVIEGVRRGHLRALRPADD